MRITQNTAWTFCLSRVSRLQHGEKEHTQSLRSPSVKETWFWFHTERKKEKEGERAQALDLQANLFKCWLSTGTCILFNCCRVWLFCNPMHCSPPGSSVRGILQARILEWVGISFCRGSSQPRDRTLVSCIGRWVLYHWVTREAQYVHTCEELTKVRERTLERMNRIVSEVHKSQEEFRFFTNQRGETSKFMKHLL